VPARDDITRLLVEWKEGDANAAAALTPLVYEELRRLAARYLRDERAAATLQPTALVHELYLRLVSNDLPDWESRAHFIGVAAHRMRQILVDYARERRAQKRGGDVEKVTLNEMLCFAPQRSADILALDEALSALAGFDDRKARVIELRYFGGLTVDETARSLGVSTGTIVRDQRVAEAWLRHHLSGGAVD